MLNGGSFELMTHEEYEEKYREALLGIRCRIIGQRERYTLEGRKIEIDDNELTDAQVVAKTQRWKAKGWCIDPHLDDEHEDHEARYLRAMRCIKENIIGKPEIDTTSKGRVIRIDERHYFDKDVFAKAWGAAAATDIMSKAPR